eukprot:11202442-Lingulodinium_polyedra.AAC.1
MHCNRDVCVSMRCQPSSFVTDTAHPDHPRGDALGASGGVIQSNISHEVAGLRTTANTADYV